MITLTEEGSEELFRRLAHFAAIDRTCHETLAHFGIEASEEEIRLAVASCTLYPRGGLLAVVVPQAARPIIIRIGQRLGELISMELGESVALALCMTAR